MKCIINKSFAILMASSTMYSMEEERSTRSVAGAGSTDQRRNTFEALERLTQGMGDEGKASVRAALEEFRLECLTPEFIEAFNRLNEGMDVWNVDSIVDSIRIISPAHLTDELIGAFNHLTREMSPDDKASMITVFSNVSADCINLVLPALTPDNLRNVLKIMVSEEIIDLFNDIAHLDTEEIIILLKRLSILNSAEAMQAETTHTINQHRHNAGGAVAAAVGVRGESRKDVTRGGSPDPGK